METEARETAGLIGSDKVEGTHVYGATGEKIGAIERVMIEKKKRPGGLCRPQLWRLPGHRHRLLSDPVAIPQL